MSALRILVIYENGAGGHRGCARAIGEALQRSPGVEAKVLEMDTLAPAYRKKMYNTFMDIRPYFRPFVQLGFRFAMRPNPFLAIYRRIDSRAQPRALHRFLDVVAEEKPDLIVATHFRPTLACNTWIERGVLNVPVHVAIPDYLCHGLYARPRIERFYVASEAAKEDLTANGINPETIQITGLPVATSMDRNDPRPRAEIKKSLGLDPEKPLFLVMGGARGDQDYGAILRAIEARKTGAQAAVLCGWNEALKADVDRIAAGLSTPIHVKGFQSNMADWYLAADVVLTKPGGMTTAETLVMGKAVVIINPHPGKEETQAERLEKTGAVLYERTSRGAVETAMRLVADPAWRKVLEDKAAAFQPSDAGARIAEEVIAAARRARAGRSA